MPAVIQSTLYVSPAGAVVPGSTQANSRDDLRLGYQVLLHSFHVATTYSWALAFASDSPGSTGLGTPFDGTESISVLSASTTRDCTFNVDFEGTYLIRLVIDAGLPTEDTQFIRARALTIFGALKLVAAGERRDQMGVIPVDATPEGWANDQNANLQRISVLLRRTATSGRVLYVDANRGRDSAAAQDDYDNVIYIPGTEVARSEETGIKMRAMAHGDFTSINDAIAYAADAVARGEPALSKTDPYYIKIRPGLYTEDLNLASFVHLLGDGVVADIDLGVGFPAPKVKTVIVRTVNAGGTGTHTYSPGALAADAEVFLWDLHLENTAATSNAVLNQTGGLLLLARCTVRQRGNDAVQGPAIRVATANVLHTPTLCLVDCQVATEALTATRSALYFDAVGGALYLAGTQVSSDACVGITFNPTLYTTSLCLITGSSLFGLHPFQGYPSYMSLSQSRLYASDPVGLLLSPPGGVGVKAGTVTVDLIDLAMVGQVQFNTLNAVGATRLTRSNVTHLWLSSPALLLPDAPGDLPTLVTYTASESVQYVRGFADPRDGLAGLATIPLLNQVPEEDVQRILDLLWLGTFPVTGTPFYSLESAYNGLATISPFTPGVGLGRNINALGGAVQIQGATYPTGPEDDLKYGGLQVEGIVDIGGFINGAPGSLVAVVGGSEIHLNPNLTGGGPFLGLGRAVWANGIVEPDRGFGGASIVAGGALAPLTGDEAYHLHLRTANLLTPNTGKTGNLYLVAGATAGANDAGEVHIVGGSHRVNGSTVGNLWLVPGGTGTPDTGVVWFVGAPDPGTGALRATLVPFNVFAAGTAGTLFIGTPAGVEVIVFTGGEANAAAAAVVVNAQARGIFAANVGGRLVLYSEYGPAGDLIYMGDSVAGALNTALGDYILGAGAVFTPGVYGDKIAVDVPQDGRLRVDGDLEVTGLIIGGGGGLGTYANVTNAMSPYTTVLGTNVLGTNTTAGIVNIEVTAAAPDGTVMVVKHETGANYTDIIPQGGETIGGAANYLLIGTMGGAVAAPNASVTFFKAGTDWKIFAEYQPPSTRVRFETGNRAWNAEELHDKYLCTLTPGADITITLDATMEIGRTITIKDQGGTANAIPSPGGQKIIIVDAGGGIFDGATPLDITTGYGSVTLVKTDTGDWSII